MTSQSGAEADFNASHVPTRPGVVAYSVAAGIVILLSIFVLAT
ncbi:MAG: hypothetical protein R3229_00280 [Alphaproteobacteria bacterium]|nr:hypothetical protein [Alphaproteobacteria bacterium]